MELRKIMNMRKNLCNCADDMSGAQVYRKTVTIRAIQMDRPFAVQTPHGLVQGQKGDYLCANMNDTDRWPVKKEIFEATHKCQHMNREVYNDAVPGAIRYYRCLDCGHKWEI